MRDMQVTAIGSPEFINMTQLSPLVSKAETKVCYVGQNRNHSYIDKPTMTEMGRTLPGSPVVGYYVEDKEDFADHGNQMIIDHNGITEKCLTKPYGFVPPDAKVWFQTFEETDEFGNNVIREYLMTECILWTSQFPECQRVIDKGNPQSMELDNETLNGHWSQDVKSGIDFFIINDALISKLCILGEDIEPCFEGANVTSQDISSTFSLHMSEESVKTMFNMVQELKTLFSNQEGGLEKMAKTKLDEFSENSQGKELETPVVNFQNNTEEFVKNADEDKKEDQNSDTDSKSKDSEEEDKDKKKNFAAEDKEDKEEKEDNKEDSEDKEKKDKYSDDDDEGEDEQSKGDQEIKEDYSCGKKDDKEEYSESTEEDDEEDYSLKYAALVKEYEKLKTDFAALKETCDALVAFKKDIDDAKKDALIAEFYMLSDEDKKDVIDNKSNYSLDEIEAKLSVICRRKKVNFDLVEENEAEAPCVYNLNQTQASNLPAWVKAVQETQNKMQ